VHRIQRGQEKRSTRPKGLVKGRGNHLRGTAVLILFKTGGGKRGGKETLPTTTRRHWTEGPMNSGKGGALLHGSFSATGGGEKELQEGGGGKTEGGCALREKRILHLAKTDVESGGGERGAVEQPPQKLRPSGGFKNAKKNPLTLEKGCSRTSPFNPRTRWKGASRPAPKGAKSTRGNSAGSPRRKGKIPSPTEEKMVRDQEVRMLRISLYVNPIRGGGKGGRWGKREQGREGKGGSLI